jgi:hypothetical protein
MKILKKLLRIVGKGLKWFFIFLIGVLLISGLYNLTLPDSSSVTEKLTDPQKAYLAEYLNLQPKVTSHIWPGFGDVKIPAIVYNEEYAFLIGIEHPDTGWYKMPSQEHRGGAWQKVSNDRFLDKSYYRQPLPDKNKTPENFTVKVGDNWVSTMQTREYAEVAFYNGFRDELPPLINWVFPYKIFWNLVMGNAENYVSGLMHEAFHAYQAMSVYHKFEKGESIARLSSEYPWESAENQKGWKKEADLLLQAYKSETDTSRNKYIREFLEQREQRRASTHISSELIDYERNREWLEGLAKYAELKTGITASELAQYKSVPQIKALSDFEDYKHSKSYLEQQIGEAKRAASRSGESRFYYLGMLQAMLLDHVAPNWKNEILKEDLYLEDLLKENIEAEDDMTKSYTIKGNSNSKIQNSL